MKTWIDRLSLTKKILFGIAWALPWIICGVFAFDLLPTRWQFHQLPDAVQGLLVFLIGVFTVLDGILSFWIVWETQHEDV